MNSTHLANVSSFPLSLRELAFKCALWTQEQLDLYDSGQETELKEGTGICGHMADAPAREEVYLGFRSLDEILAAIFEQWPEYSGNPTYPVPATEDDEEYMDEFDDLFYDDPAEYAYEENTCVWDGTYGESRRALLTFIIDSLRASLPSTQEDPKAAAPVSPSAAYKPTHGGYPG